MLIINLTMYFEEHFTQFKDLLLEHGERHLLKADTIITNDSDDLYLYYIENGLFKLSLMHEEGALKTVCFHGEGSICPYSLSRPNATNDYQIDVDFFVISAITDVETIRIKPEVFHQLLLDNGQLGVTMIDYIIKHSNLFMSESVTISYDPAFTRTCNFVYIYTQYLNKKGIQLTQSEIGEMVGLTRLEVARALKKLREMFIITTTRTSINVLDIQRLKDQCTLTFSS